MENEAAKQISADEPQIFDVAEAMKRRDHISGRVDMARSPNSFVAVFQTKPRGGEAHVRHGTTLIEAIWIIIVADVVMSLDNVIGVAGAAGGNLTLVVFGIGLSIPIVVWGSGVLATLMNRYAWIILIAGGILGEVAGKMIVHDEVVVRRVGGVPKPIEWALRLVLAGGIMLIGWIAARRRAVTPDEGAAG